MLLGRDPAVDQSLPKRSECHFAILVRSKPLGPLVICQHALTIVREPVIKSSALRLPSIAVDLGDRRQKGLLSRSPSKAGTAASHRRQASVQILQVPIHFPGSGIQSPQHGHLAVAPSVRSIGPELRKGCRVAAPTQLVVIAHHPSGESLRPRTQVLGDLLLEPTPPTARDGVRHIAIDRDRILSRGQLRVGRE